MKTKNWVLMFFVLAALIFNGCNKEKEMIGHMTVKMTDAPAAYLAVNVEIVEFQVHYANAPGDAWVSLPINAGIYDLLTLQNDVTATLVSDSDLAIGHITQVRLILGDQNTIATIDGSIHDLKIPSGSETGIKINLNTDIQANQTVEVLLDFDADASIVLEGNGSFSLKPVIKVESVTQL